MIPVILGTAREGRESEKVAKWITKNISKSKLIDVRKYKLNQTDNSKKPKAAKEWAKMVKNSKKNNNRLP